MLFGRRKPGYTTTVDSSVDPEQAVLDLQKAELAAKKKPKAEVFDINAASETARRLKETGSSFDGSAAKTGEDVIAAVERETAELAAMQAAGAAPEAAETVQDEAAKPQLLDFLAGEPEAENDPFADQPTQTAPENIRCRDSKLFDQTLKRENMELYFRLGGADYLQACREIAYDHREPTPTLEDAVCGMAGTVAAICALCEDEDSEVSDLARELYYSSLLLQELVEWYQSRRQERENYEEEYEQYHGFDMTMM